MLADKIFSKLPDAAQVSTQTGFITLGLIIRLIIFRPPKAAIRIAYLRCPSHHIVHETRSSEDGRFSTVTVPVLRNNLHAESQLLGHRCCQATQQVISLVNLLIAGWGTIFPNMMLIS